MIGLLMGTLLGQAYAMSQGDHSTSPRCACHSSEETGTVSSTPLVVIGLTDEEFKEFSRKQRTLTETQS
jgi:hypothetical protein